jgi:hypothetical protein
MIAAEVTISRGIARIAALRLNNGVSEKHPNHYRATKYLI